MMNYNMQIVNVNCDIDIMRPLKSVLSGVQNKFSLPLPPLEGGEELEQLTHYCRGLIIGADIFILDLFTG